MTSKPTYIRLSEETNKALKEIAIRTGLSMRAVIQSILDERLGTAVRIDQAIKERETP